MYFTVSAVRLMRIELGGAFADLLNEQGKGSGDNEMGYVERTLGFRTRDLDDRDLRLVSFFAFSSLPCHASDNIKALVFMDFLKCLYCRLQRLLEVPFAGEDI